MQSDWCHYKRRHRQRHTGRRQLCGDGDRDWSDAPISQGTPKIVGNHQKLEEARKFPLRVSEGAWAC